MGCGSFYYEEVWLIPGPHSSRGPRGYQRSDQCIEEDICERLTQHRQIDAEDIQVMVENGEVALTGTVENRQVKRMAEDALDSISGVKDIRASSTTRARTGRVRICSSARRRWARRRAARRRAVARAATNPDAPRLPG